MAMSSSTADGEVMVEMNTTPLIDVMLVLLTLLIITLPIQTHAVKLDMPRPNQAPPAGEPVVVALGIDFDGSITWNGDKVDRAALDTKLYDASHQPTPPEIQIERTSDGGLLMIATEERLDPDLPEHASRARILADTMIARAAIGDAGKQ